MKAKAIIRFREKRIKDAYTILNVRKFSFFKKFFPQIIVKETRFSMTKMEDSFSIINGKLNYFSEGKNKG